MMAKRHEHSECRELLDQLTDYVDGELEPGLCAELEAHLAECPNCRVMVDTVRKTITLYHAQAATALPSDVEDRLYKVLKITR
jgi:anti-sigma factor (TIGR02949 family)